ncbi:MAG TPA: hypothetical protein VM056_04840 [Terriglobales bacterium]|nr:hypothetical protein [Terriglobales bacterium]
MAISASDTAHFRLLAEVRWHVFRNSLRVEFKRVEILVRAFTWISGVTVVSVVGLLFALNGYFLFVKRPIATYVLLWLVAFVWQILPLVMEGSAPVLDFRELARYPIRFRLYYAMSVVYGLLDPVAFTCVVWIASLGLGIMIGHPWTIPWVLIFLPLFALVNLLFNRAMYGWFRSMVGTRRNREILVATGVLLLVIAQISVWNWMPKLESEDLKKQMQPVVKAINQYSPMGLAANAIRHPEENSLIAFGLLGGGCLLFGWFLFRQLKPMYLGETQSEAEVRSAATQAQPGWRIPFAGPQFSAIVEKEIRYFFRENRLWVNQVSIWAFVLVATMGPAFMNKAFGFSQQRRGEFLYPVAISYSLIMLSTLAYNCFWSDAGGYYRWLLSPVRMRQVVQAKNISFGIAALVNFWVVTAIVRVDAIIPALKILNGFLITCLLALAVVSAGNLLSGWFPKKIKQGSFNTKNASEAATIIGLLWLGAIAALSYGAHWAGKYWQEPLLVPAFLFLLILAAVGAYLVSLKLAAEYLESNQDKMCDELV